MRKIILFLLAGFILFGTLITISAHDFWLVPKKFRIASGDTLTILANTGMDFPVSLSAVAPNRIAKIMILGESYKEDIKDLAVQGNSLVAKHTIKKSGTFVVAAAVKPNEIKLTGKEFNEYLLADGLPNIYELRKKEGILDKDAVEFYSKYPKTIVQVGKTDDDVATRHLGLPIEIVPQVNPYTLTKGDDLKVTVFFQGDPLPNTDIAWSYPGQGEEFAGTTKTDGSGQAVIPLEKTGPYVIRMTHMEWVKKPTHEWESYWTSLTFEVLSDKTP